jgi:cytochrome c oxidase assembly protein Cox11
VGLGHSPSIVLNGLVLALDAANTKSYLGSGSTWTDLSGRGNTGTLENSPSYNSSNGGSLSFNGTTQRVVCGNSANLQITVGTISAWFNANNGNSSYNGIIAKQSAWGLFVADNILVTYDWGNTAERSTGITVGNSTWNCASMTFTETIGTPSNNAIVYLNGSPVLTTTVRHSNHTVQVMVGEANSSQFFGGNISQVSIYNRALTATEVSQNFNALRGRYGI